jgi:hypothetical protein
VNQSFIHSPLTLQILDRGIASASLPRSIATIEQEPQASRDRRSRRKRIVLAARPRAARNRLFNPRAEPDTWVRWRRIDCPMARRSSTRPVNCPSISTRTGSAAGCAANGSVAWRRTCVWHTSGAPDEYRAEFGLKAQRPLQAPGVSEAQAATFKHRIKTDRRLQGG